MDTQKSGDFEKFFLLNLWNSLQNCLLRMHCGTYSKRNVPFGKALKCTAGQGAGLAVRNTGFTTKMIRQPFAKSKLFIKISM